MKRIKRWIKAFIVQTIIEDYKANGPIRQTVGSERSDWKPLFGEPGKGVKIHGQLKAGNAFTKG